MSRTPAKLGELSAVKLALMARQVRAEAASVLRADPIAIVGMGCRVPGGGDGPEAFWELLCLGTDAVREVPPDRWDAEAWYDTDPAAPGKLITKWAGFLPQVDGFDADYFGILPREAERMDPQQRLLLEVAIEALEDAGLTREALRGTRTGVYIASYHNDYSIQQYADLEDIDSRTLTGTLHSVLANRLSFFLDLKGPSLSLDTACSSSLVAVHLACQGLRSGETEVAVAGGVSVIIGPELMVSMSKVGFMAPDGRSRTFDARANGFGRGEGCGIVVLKRLADAIADGDRALAVIRGSAVNQDGHSTLLAAPNGLAQRAMLAEALASAQLDPSRIGLVETHGTGTALGDPIEVEAIAEVVGQPSPGAGPCWLGAVKANLGHLEAAAGVTGLIKAVLALRHGAAPKQIHFEKLNPHIRLDGTRLVVPTALTPWPAGAQARCAGVSSFGVGGTNAHVVLEEAPPLPVSPPAAELSRILPLSAQRPEALRALAERWVGFLERTPAGAAELCYTASERRSHLEHRLAVFGKTKDELRAALQAWLSGGSLGAAAQRASRGAPKVSFVFGGQGPQWWAMGRELLEAEPAFGDAIRKVDSLLAPLAGWSLLEELGRDEATSRLDQTAFAQPALFAIQVALAELWKVWGVEPSAVVGHSVGEIAALRVAGALELPEAVRVVFHRARIMQEATGLGRMAQVSLDEEAAAAAVRPYGERLSVAALNGPRTSVLSGEEAALDEVLARLEREGVGQRRLPVKYAFHSAQMAPFQRRLDDALAGLSTQPARIPFCSTVTGVMLAERVAADYFGRNVREPVRFARAIGTLAAAGHDVFLELGPHPVLAASIGECLEAAGKPGHVLTSLRRSRPERETMLQACAGLYAAGVDPAWAEVQRAPADVVSLPAYPWQRRRYWIRKRPAALAPPERAGAHPLLGRAVPVAGLPARVFEGGWSGEPAWVADHRIGGRVVLPATAMMELFYVASAPLGPGRRLEAFAVERALLLPEPGEGRGRWQVVASEAGTGRLRLELHEATGEEGGEPDWRRVATAEAMAATGEPAPSAASRGEAAESVASADVYAAFEALGVAFGPVFRRLGEVRRGERFAEGRVALEEAAGLAIHPAVLDAGLQLCSLAAPRTAGDAPVPRLLLPVGVDRIELLRKPADGLRAFARVREVGASGSIMADVVFEDGAPGPVAILSGARFAPAHAEDVLGPATDATAHQIAWKKVPEPSAPAGSPTAKRWLLLCDRGGAGEALARELQAAGASCVRAFAGAAYARADEHSFTFDPSSPEGFKRLVAEARGDGPVVHLLGLDVAGVERLGTDEEEERDQQLAVGSLLSLAQALSGAAGPLWVVTRGAHVVTGEESADGLRPRAAGAWGLASVVAVEEPGLSLRAVDLDPAEPSAGCAGLSRELLSAGAPAVAIRGGARWAPRLERRTEVGGARGSGEPLGLVIERPGTLDGLALRPRPRLAPGKDEVRLRVTASGLNFRDVLLALGMYPGDGIPLGAECAGVVEEAGAEVHDLPLGARVFGFVPASLGTEVVVPAAFLAPVPAGLRDEDAAALPVAYLTAWYGLHTLAGLKAGERVLVHAAAGGVGLAAVRLAQRAGAEVIATAGSPAKRELLASLGVRTILDSRSLSFADGVRAATGGEGVDVVLNSLAGDFIPASLGVLRRGGRFLELGKRGILTAEEAARQRPDVRYHAFDLGAEAMADRGLLKPMLRELVAALAKGEVQPLPVKVFPLEQASEAFRFMAQARHVGKIVLRPQTAGGRISPDATYLVTGGLGGLGIETARWLVRSGARSLALVGRRAPDATASGAIAALQREGAKVHVFSADASDETDMAGVLAALRKPGIPPLRGVFHGAGALEDGPLVHQTWDRCRNVLRGKARGAFVLHALTRELPLDFFVLYSAAGLYLGASGQGAYPAANAELDALAHARRRAGLPALSVGWGTWAEVGMLARLASQGRNPWVARGLLPITPATGFPALEQLLRDGAVHALVLPIRWKDFLAQPAPGLDSAFFAAVAPKAAEAQPAQTSRAAGGLGAKLKALAPAQRRPALLAELTARAAQVIGLDTSKPIDPRVPLREVGLDSLMSVELRNVLARAVGQPLPATLVFDHPTADALADHLLKLLVVEPGAKPEQAVPAAAPAPAPQDQRAREEVAALSDAEAEAALLAELEGGGAR